MLQIPADQRLAYISAVIKEEKIRFPGATFAKETGQDSGNISKMLKGDLPVSDKFFTTFLHHHPKVPESWELENVPLPVGGLKVTLKDHFDLMKEHTEYIKKHASIMERLVEARLLQKEDASSAAPKKAAHSAKSNLDVNNTFRHTGGLVGKSEVHGQDQKQGSTPAKGNKSKE